MDCSPIRQNAILKRHLRRQNWMNRCCPVSQAASHPTDCSRMIRVSQVAARNCSPIRPIVRCHLRVCYLIRQSVILIEHYRHQNCCRIVHLNQNPTGCRIAQAAPRLGWMDCRIVREFQAAARNCCPIRLIVRCHPTDCCPIRRSVIPIERCPIVPNCRCRRMNRVSQIGMGLIHWNYCLGWLARCRDGSARQNPVNAKQKMARRSACRSRTYWYAQRSNPVNSRQGDL